MTNLKSRDYIGIEGEEIVPNIDFSERVISIGTGTYMIYKGVRDLFSHPLSALGQVAIGSALLYRGASGSCGLKSLVEGETKDEAEFL